MNTWILAGTSFLASGVEAVEALTIVLAVGFSRSWKASLSGAAWASAALAAIVLILGPAIVTYVPLRTLKAGVGIFLLLFGLAWLRKAILRYGGRKALHDEDAIYAREVAELRGGDYRTAFLTSFNGVLLEGLEVAVIVLTFGASSASGFWWAALGAAAAVAVVIAAGVAARKPLANVPENTMKFVVGIMLTSFGTFWSGEGLGIAWWRDDLSLAWIVALFVAVSAAGVFALRRSSAHSERQAA